MESTSTHPTKMNKREAYIVTVDMGYGHQRAVYPLASVATAPETWNETGGIIIVANNYQGIPKRDQKLWTSGQSFYEKISRMKRIPLLGTAAFGLMDYMQRIQSFYPKRAEKDPSFQLKQIYGLIARGWGKHLIDTLNEKPLPLITSFFTIAFFAEEHGYQGDIYCICTDTDVSRAWAPLNAETTRIKYLAPTFRVKERLIRYGVPEKNIITTGFPLPSENIGKDFDILKTAVGRRLCALDPENKWREKYMKTLEQYLGAQYCTIEDHHALTVTFAVGGAGAQREVASTIVRSLQPHILAGRIKLNLIAGSRHDVFRYFEDLCRELNLTDHGHLVNIVYDQNKYHYFEKFNQVLNETDVLWTKPSELSFYAGLGLPIIMTEPVGSQEDFNRQWLLSTGAGIDQLDPKDAGDWLLDWAHSGWLAEAAYSGFANTPHQGTNRVLEVVFEGQTKDIEETQIL